MLRLMCLIEFVILTLVSVNTHAGYVGPQEVVSAKFGASAGELGQDYGDTEDLFAACLSVSVSGKIAICDVVNNRIVIFNSDGTLIRNINILSSGVVFDNEENIFMKAEFRKIDQAGSQVFVKDIGFDEIYIAHSNAIVGFKRDKKLYYVYSSEGDLLRSTSKFPIELGIIREKRLPDGRYMVEIVYPDKTYSFSAAGPSRKYIRDINDNLYGVSEKFVNKFDSCGKKVDSLELPDAEFKVIQESGRGFDEMRQILAQYGEPVVAPNGDVYTWKRTPTTYSILKWTWEDDPKAPKESDCGDKAKKHKKGK